MKTPCLARPPGGIKGDMPDPTYSHSVYVSVAQRHWDRRWSAERNRTVYGTDASEEGFGSNLKVTLTVSAAKEGADPARELESPVSALKFVKDLLDHRCLFEEFPEFRERASTLERIVLYLVPRVKEKAPAVIGLRVEDSEGLVCGLRPVAHAGGGLGATSVNDKVGGSLETTPALEFEARAFNLVCLVRRSAAGLNDGESSGLALDRQLIFSSLKELGPEFAEAEPGGHTDRWGQRLFLRLADKVKGLHEVRVDLGCHRALHLRP